MKGWITAIVEVLFIVTASAALPQASAEKVLPQVEAPFKGKIAASAKDSVPDWPEPLKAPAGSPNIVLILLDDTGFGDASTFGGPAQTPELDNLAAQGLRYNRFHVSAACSLTRAALLSGRNDHKAAFGTTVDSASGFPGYNGIWRKDTVSVAEVLRRNGYSTAAFGKWHNTPFWEVSPVGPFDHWPTSLGFEYFYGFMGLDQREFEPTLYRNTAPVELPGTKQQGYHLTADLTDQAISWLHTHESLAPDKPYFLYFATGATHIPHQVPREWIRKYHGQFDQGWDKVREETFARQKKLGVIPADAELTPRPDGMPAWDTLSADMRRLLARQMEVYAAYLSQTDHEVGRLVKVIQESPQGENTLILYIVGDNGAMPGPGAEGSEEYGDFDPAHFQPLQERLRYIDELGSELFMNSYAVPWAWASDTPFQSTKEDASHFGGTRDPMIASWPARIKDKGGLRTQFTDVNDVAATLYEITGIRFPSEVDGVKQQALDGVSFAYTFEQPSARSRHLTQIFETDGNRAIYQEGWVAAAPHCLAWKCPVTGTDLSDFGSDRWELYHIDTDYSEAHDVAKQFPDKLKAMKDLFDTEARKENIYPLGAVDVKGQPHPARGRREFIYYPDLPRTPSAYVVPDFSQSHRITAQAVIPEDGAEGVIIASGSRSAGFALYLKDKRLIYENHPLGASRAVIASRTQVPYGEVTLGYEFIADAPEANMPGPLAQLFGSKPAPGTGRLYINGRLVGEGRQGPVSRYVLGDESTLGIGRIFPSPVSPAFDPPFKFTGTLTRVQVKLD
jgi:arylsulfatase